MQSSISSSIAALARQMVRTDSGSRRRARGRIDGRDGTRAPARFVHREGIRRPFRPFMEVDMLHRFVGSAVGIASFVLTACTSPFSPPSGFSEVPCVRINVIPDANASLGDVKVFRNERQVLVVGRVQNETMRAFSGGRVEAQFLDASGAVKAAGAGKIESTLVASHGSAPFRLFVEYAGPLDACRITVHPDIEGR